MSEIEIVAVPMGEFRFAADEPLAGELGVVIAYVIRHPAGLRAPRHRLRIRQRRAGRVLPDQGAAGRRCPRRCGVRDRRHRHGRELPPPRRPRGPERSISGCPDLRPGRRVGGRPHDRPHHPRVDRLPRAPTTATSRATTTSLPASGSWPRRVTRPATSRWRSRPAPASSSLPARRSTRPGSGPTTRALGRAGRVRRIPTPTTDRSRASGRPARSRSGSPTTRASGGGEPPMGAALLSFAGRARRGTSGAL